MWIKWRETGFTLIELLIVVAIIGILAAIAVPNFLNAQTRAKVSKVQADFRTLATAIESYRLEYGNYMPYPEWGQHTGPAYLGALSTPIAFITSADSIHDPFRRKHESDNDGIAEPRYGATSSERKKLGDLHPGTSRNSGTSIETSGQQNG